MKPKRHVCTCLTPATHWCPKTGKQYCQQHAEHYASVFGEESLKTFPADKAKPVINKSSELNAANQRIRLLIAKLYKYQDRIQQLEEAGDALKAAGYFGGFGDAVNKWIKVREDKP